MARIVSTKRPEGACNWGARAQLGAAVLLAATTVASGCLGGSKKKPAPSAPAAAPATVAAGTPSASPRPPLAVRPFTASPSTPRPTPRPTPVAGLREENGLKIQDEQFVGRVTTSGGLRVRSAPNASAANVVGSIPEGALVTVEGKVINGAEAEQGKGTVWYIVGVKQYIYGADGYVQRVAGNAPSVTPAAR